MELEHLGWNVLTISSIGVIFFALLGSWGLIDQNKKIWQNRSGESISIIWFICSAFFFLTTLIYGVSIKSIATALSGLVRIPPHIPILLGLWRFKGFSKWEKGLFCSLAIIIITMILSSHKEIYFLFFSLGVLIPAAAQPWEIWRKKSAGVVSIKMLWIYNLSSGFWIVYSIKIWNLPLLIVSIVFSVIFISTIGLWFRYKKRTI